MKPLFALAALAAVTLTSPAFASADLAAKKNCMACHAVDKKLVGPAYKDVAAKYAGDKTAAAKLADKIVTVAAAAKAKTVDEVHKLELEGETVEAKILALTSMIEPVMILVMGVAVSFIVVSILLPIFEMNQLIR